jgi:hypothetical protein
MSNHVGCIMQINASYGRQSCRFQVSEVFHLCPILPITVFGFMHPQFLFVLYSGFRIKSFTFPEGRALTGIESSVLASRLPL